MAVSEVLKHIDWMLKQIAGCDIAAGLDCPMELNELCLRTNGIDDEYKRGAIGSLFMLYALICKTPDGRKAASDLGFKPVFQDVESPASGGRND